MRARVVAPLVAAVLGIAGGVATAIVVPARRRAGHRGVQRPAAPRHPAGRPGLHRASRCWWSATATASRRSAPPSPTAARRACSYLRSDESCATMLGPERKPTPTYVVYRGPYDSRRSPRDPDRAEAAACRPGAPRRATGRAAQADPHDRRRHLQPYRKLSAAQAARRTLARSPSGRRSTSSGGTRRTPARRCSRRSASGLGHPQFPRRGQELAVSWRRSDFKLFSSPVRLLARAWTWTSCGRRYGCRSSPS